MNMNTLTLQILVMLGCLAVLIPILVVLIKRLPQSMQTSKGRAAQLASETTEKPKRELRAKYPMEYARLVWFYKSCSKEYLNFSKLLGLHYSMVTFDLSDSFDVKLPRNQMEMSQSDLDYLEAYAKEYPAEYHGFVRDNEEILQKALKSFDRVAAVRAGIEGAPINKEQNFKQREKSAAGAMVKGAVVGKLIGGDAGAVVGAMVAKEQHDHKNKDKS